MHDGSSKGCNQLLKNALVTFRPHELSNASIDKNVKCDFLTTRFSAKSGYSSKCLNTSWSGLGFLTLGSPHHTCPGTLLKITLP